MKKLRTTNVNCFGQRKSYGQQMLIAYAYEKVMDHKCYLFMPLKELETIKIHFLIINLLQMFIAYAY